MKKVFSHFFQTIKKSRTEKMRPLIHSTLFMPLAAIIASPLFEYDATSLAHLVLGSLASLRQLSSSIRLDGEHRCTMVFRSPQRCLNGFKSVFWLSHSRTFTELSWSYSCDVLALLLGLVTFWKPNPHPRLRALWSRFSSGTVNCTLLHSSSPLSWLVSPFLLLKDIPTPWCYQHLPCALY